jgi:hypothetical protein
MSKIFEKQSNDIVLLKQHNEITSSYNSLTAIEKNIMYMLMAQLRDDDPDGKIYKIHVKELEKLTNSQPGYTYLKEASRKLISRLYTIFTQNEILQLALLTSARYKKGTGIIELELSSEIRPFFFALKNNYTLFQFQTVMRLKSKYSKGIYEMLSQFKSTGIFKISVDELKKRFDLIDLKSGKEQYADFSLFASKVLEVAKREINQSTEISFEYITKKTGRKITDLEFRISYEETMNGLIGPGNVNSKLIELKDRLVSKFKLSKTLAQKVIENIPYDEINKILYDINLDDSDRRIKKMGAYATTVFQNRLNDAEASTKQPAIVHSDLSTHASQIAIERATSQEKNQQEEASSIMARAINNGRSNGLIAVGDHLAQFFASNRVIEKNMPSDEEKKLKEEKRYIWNKLHRIFKIHHLEVDSLIESYSTEVLKSAIDAILEEMGAQETLPDHAKMIENLKNRLKLS